MLSNQSVGKGQTNIFFTKVAKAGVRLSSPSFSHCEDWHRLSKLVIENTPHPPPFEIKETDLTLSYLYFKEFNIVCFGRIK